MTSVQWLDSLGVLNERSVIAHCIFLDHHPWLHWTSRKDLELLADCESTVAHCPTVFSRRGIALNTFGAYLDHGIRMSVGTDTYPHNMLDECRTAVMVARVIGQSVTDLDCIDVFNAATVAGADALNRSDIGRLAVGCKADFSTIDLTSPSMRPVREPLRSLITVAGSRPVTDVFVHGEQVVSNGDVLNIDFELELTRLQVAQQNMLNVVSEKDWDNRSAVELAPLMLTTVESI
jgi:cytosine/adenosine deaminase-related metal-dependent hydrolase